MVLSHPTPVVIKMDSWFERSVMFTFMYQKLVVFPLNVTLNQKSHTCCLKIASSFKILIFISEATCWLTWSARGPYYGVYLG